MDNNRLEKIRNRQLARFLDHLKKTGQLTPGLESDVKRAYSYFSQDIETLLSGEVLTFGHDEEKEDGKPER